MSSKFHSHRLATAFPFSPSPDGKQRGPLLAALTGLAQPHRDAKRANSLVAPRTLATPHRIDRQWQRAPGCQPSRRPAVTEQIQAASQTQLSCHKFEFVVVALTILLLSMAGVAGVLPLIPESNASDSGIATGAAIQYKQMPSLQATLNGIATMGATAEVKAELFNSAGVDYLSRKDSHNAVLAFEKAVEVNPEFVAAYNNLGMAYLQDGDRKAAKEAFAFALKLQPGNSYAQQQLVN